jgi:hypothetical protein
MPPVRVGHLADDGQSQAGTRQRPRRAGPVEALEDVRQVLLVDAGPVVAERQVFRPEADLDEPAGVAPLRRVVQQGSYGISYEGAVALDDDGFQARVETHPRVAAGRPGDRVADQVVELDLLEDHLTLPRTGEVQQAVHGADEVLHLAPQVADEEEAVALSQAPGLVQDLDIRLHARQGGEELVGGVAHQPALAAVGLLQLLEHGCEALAEPAQLVGASDVHPGREVTGLGDLLGTVGEPLDRLQARAATNLPSSSATLRPPTVARPRITARWRRCRWSSPSGSATWSAAPSLRGTVRTR